MSKSERIARLNEQLMDLRCHMAALASMDPAPSMERLLSIERVLVMQIEILQQEA